MSSSLSIRARWQAVPLKFKLALWFTLVTGGIALLMVPLAYQLVNDSLYTELDKELQVDWDLVETHLEPHPETEIGWRRNSPASPESRGYASTSFDVWQGDRRLLSHVASAHQGPPLPRPRSSESKEIYSIPSSTQPATRCYQKAFRLAGKTYLLRTFRSEAGIEEVMHQIFTGFTLGIPIAVVLAALGGSILTARLLSPLKAMGERARTINSASLSQRLPNPAPHSELGELATLLNGSLARLERSFDSLRRFTADASHELRTPLTALRSVGEVALHRPGTQPDDFREAIASMLEEAARMETLIETLLMLARTEGGQIHLRPKVIDLREFLEEIALTLAVLAQEKGQELTIAVQGKVQIRSDSALLRQVVLNLIDNAIRYSPQNTPSR